MVQQETSSHNHSIRQRIIAVLDVLVVFLATFTLIWLMALLPIGKIEWMFLVYVVMIAFPLLIMVVTRRDLKAARACTECDHPLGRRLDPQPHRPRVFRLDRLDPAPEAYDSPGLPGSLVHLPPGRGKCDRSRAAGQFSFLPGVSRPW
jgi:hypothetical protein